MFYFFIIFFITILSNAIPQSYYNRLYSTSPYSNHYMPNSFRHHIAFTDYKKITRRITGGYETTPYSHPYTVGLNILTHDGIKVWCGGVLISERFIVTAAHCLKNSRHIFTMLGCHSRKGNCLKIKTISKDFIVHESYNPSKFQNDIALIKLPRSVPFSEHIEKIHLPDASLTDDFLETKILITTGWGFYQDGNSMLSDTLREVKLKVLPLDVCRRSYKQAPRRTNICTDGSSLQSTCGGDSGGPLLYDRNGYKILIGITSYGYKYGCEKGYPSVFTRISSYVDWIEENMI